MAPESFTAEDKRVLTKLRVDVWEGSGKENPSITSRLALLEEEAQEMGKDIEKINASLTKILWLGLGTLATVVGEIVFKAIVGKG